MSTPALSSHNVKQLSQVLHTTSKLLGRPSTLATHREMLSKLLGFGDWNAACALLPEHSNGTTHVAIALLEVPSLPTKSFITTGNDAPWRLPEKIRDHLIRHSLDSAGCAVLKYSRPDPAGGMKQRYWEFALHLTGTEEQPKVEKVPFGPHTPDYGRADLTPTVVTFADRDGRASFTVTVWYLTLQSSGMSPATNFTGAASLPLYNTFVESITSRAPGLRQAYCLVNSREGQAGNAIVRCNELGSELEIVEHLPYMQDDVLWSLVAPYNNALGLSLLDVADITDACFSNDNDDDGDTYV